MTDDELLASLLRRGLTEEGFDYWNVTDFPGGKHLTIDGQLRLTDDEFATLTKIVNPEVYP